MKEVMKTMDPHSDDDNSTDFQQVRQATDDGVSSGDDMSLRASQQTDVELTDGKAEPRAMVIKATKNTGSARLWNEICSSRYNHVNNFCALLLIIRPRPIYQLLSRALLSNFFAFKGNRERSERERKGREGKR